MRDYRDVPITDLVTINKAVMNKIWDEEMPKMWVPRQEFNTSVIRRAITWNISKMQYSAANSIDRNIKQLCLN